MATRPKAVIESRNGEKLSPITIAKNVLTDDGQNLHDILSNRKEEEEDVMTPTIENSSSMFKVGQGDDVDYSANVVNGAYESMVLKGKTMVNCIQESSSKDVVLPYEFEDGQYVTINDTKESGALGVELKGQTLVNVLNYSDRNDFTTYGGVVDEEKYITFSANNDWNSSVIFKMETARLKPNTRYTIMLDIKENTITQTGNESIEFGSANTVNPNGYFTDALRPNLVGVKGLWKGLLTTKSSFDNIENSAILLRCYARVSGVLKVRVSIIEGDYTNVDIPYFEGMTSCKMPILHSCQQLFDYNAVTKPSASGDIGFVKNESSIKVSFSNTNRDVHQNTSILIPAGTYEVSYMIRGELSSLPTNASVSNSKVGLAFEPNHSWSSNSAKRLEVSYATLSDTEFTKKEATLTFSESQKVTIFYHGWNNNPVGWCEFKDIRITQQGKSSILSLPEEVVLRSLPNGVCDTFNTRTGVYTQRIGEYTYNGSEEWKRVIASGRKTTVWYVADSVLSRINMLGSTKKTEQIMSISDKFPTYSRNDSYIISRDDEYVCSEIVCINDSRLTDVSINGFKQWISQNPVTIQYQLATPIVTKINLSSTLKSWNTTTHIYSEIPENTLYPILSHSNPTYPVILKPSTKYSIVANSYSNNHTNSTINFNLGGATASTTVGNRVTTITTPSTLSNELLTMSGRGNKLNNVMVIEGDVVGDESYFEGICDCKSPILLNVGENLFNINGEINEKFSNMLANDAPNTVDGNTIIASSWTNNYHGRGQKIKIRRGMPYTCSFTSSDNGRIIIHTPYKVNFTGTKPSTFTFIAPTDCDEIIIAFNTSGSASGGKIHNLCVIEGDMTSAEYEPYKSNILSFNQKDDKTIVLRSLPNGVCDTLNVETGEYVQRIGEYTVNGTETSWFTYIDTTGANNNYLNQTSCAFGVHLTGKAKGNGILCDKLPTRSVGWWANKNTEEGICGIDNDNRIFLRVKNEKTGVLYTDNVPTALEKVKTYLASNPVTVQYELATPIVSTIDIQGFPHAYTNGHVQLSSGSIEQSLTPKVEYSVVTNRNGQIRSNQKMVERHQKQLDRLQAMILTNLVNTQYEQTLTNLKYDLKNVREEVK